jgi:hypothetical protein
MLFKEKNTEIQIDVYQKESHECKSCEWVWGNGRNYCPFCETRLHDSHA